MPTTATIHALRFLADTLDIEGCSHDEVEVTTLMRLHTAGFEPFFHDEIEAEVVRLAQVL